jgi:outer membrane protein
MRTSWRASPIDLGAHAAKEPRRSRDVPRVGHGPDYSRVIPAFFSRSFLSGSVAVAALGVALTASPAGAETLADAIASAYDHNPVLVQQRYVQRARDEGYVQARAGYGPTLQVQGSGGYSSRRVAGRTIDSDANEARATIQQPLYTAGRLRGALESARSTVLAGQEELRRVEQEVLQNVIFVYAAVLRDEARLEVARENLEVLRGQRRQNSTRQQKGDVTLTDVAQSTSREAAAEQQLATVEAALAASRGQYRQIVGRNPGTLEPLPRLPSLPGSVDEAFARAEDRNPEILSAKYGEQAASADAASVRGQRGPTVALTGEAVYSNRLLRFDGRSGSRELFGGFTITQPIFNSGAIQSRVREADARDYAAQAGIDIARRAVLQDVTAAWSGLGAARTALIAGRRQVEAAQAAFAGMSCEELNGLRTTIETLNAERELQDAQLTLLQSRYQLYVNHAALLAAMGSLSAQDIVANISAYDPEANFRAVRNRGMTPFEYVAMGIDRIGSAAVRRPLSADLTGADVPVPDAARPLAAEPEAAVIDGKLVPIRDSRLRLPDGRSARCPLGVPPTR